MAPMLDVPTTPAQTAAYRNDILSEALRTNAPLINDLWGSLPDDEMTARWNAMSQHAVDAMGEYMARRIAASKTEAGAFMDPDGSEPLRSYIAGWVNGYAMRATAGNCIASEVTIAADELGIDLSHTEDRQAYARQGCKVKGYSAECGEMAAGHIMLVSLLSFADGQQENLAPEYSWRGDADGFADGWWYAKEEGLGEEDDEPEDWSLPSADTVDNEDEDDFADWDGTGWDGHTLEGDSNEDGFTDWSPAPEEEEDPETPSVIFDESPDEQPSTPDEEPAAEEDTDDHAGEGTDDRMGVDAVDAGTPSEAETKPSPAPSTQAEAKEVDGRREQDARHEALPSHGERRKRHRNRRGHHASHHVHPMSTVPPALLHHIDACVKSALRNNVEALKELMAAGMTKDAATALRDILRIATAKYAMVRLAETGKSDGVPKETGGAEPIMTYAHSWIQGYVSAATDGEFSSHEIARYAEKSIFGAVDIADDMDRIEDRCSWDSRDPRCADVTIDHLIVVMTPHGRDFPLAHPLYSSKRYSVTGDADGFSDGWWKATYDQRNEAEKADETTANQIIGEAQAPEEERQDESSDRHPRNKRHDPRNDAYVMSVVEEVKDEKSDTDEQLVGESLPFAAGTIDSKPRRTTPSVAEVERQQIAEARTKIMREADRCVSLVLKVRQPAAKKFRQMMGMDKQETSDWLMSAVAATIAYGERRAIKMNENPSKASDGTLPMESYADGWVCGSITGALGHGVDEREIQRIANVFRVSLADEAAAKVHYVKGECDSRGTDHDCTRETVNRIRYQHIIHEGQNPDREKLFDYETYNWIGDADGFIDGFLVGKSIAESKRA